MLVTLLPLKKTPARHGRPISLQEKEEKLPLVLDHKKTVGDDGNAHPPYSLLYLDRVLRSPSRRQLWIRAPTPVERKIECRPKPADLEGVIEVVLPRLPILLRPIESAECHPLLIRERRRSLKCRYRAILKKSTFRKKRLPLEFLKRRFDLCPDI